jgi:hypothetical protein
MNAVLGVDPSSPGRSSLIGRGMAGLRMTPGDEIHQRVDQLGLSLA